MTRTDARAADAAAIAAYWSTQPQSYASDEHGGTTFRTADGGIVTAERRSGEFSPTRGTADGRCSKSVAAREAWRRCGRNAARN
jgi:hypothetical protein